MKTSTLQLRKLSILFIFLLGSWGSASAQTPLTIVGLTPLTYNGGVNIRCYGQSNGRAIMNATGGVAPYTYLWSFGTTSNLVGGSQYNLMPAGPFSVTVIDATGASVTASGVLTQNPPIDVTASWTPILCYGGTSTVTVTPTAGTAPYSGVQTYNNVLPGSYNYFIADANGCRDNYPVVIGQPPLLDATASTTEILCYGDTAQVTVAATGGVTPYTGTGIFNEVDGLYSYTVTDANGCTDNVVVGLIQPAQLTAMISNTPILCNGGTSQVTVTVASGTEPYTGTGVFTEYAGYHTYTVYDFNGCSDTISTLITEPTALVASALGTSILCVGGTADVTVSATGGTAPYSGTGVNTVSAGTYAYTVTDANGCSMVASASISEPTALVASTSATAIACAGGSTSIAVTATGGTAPYSGAGTFSRPAGTHTFTVTDANGCSVNVSQSVSAPAALAVTATAPAIACGGTTTNVTVSAVGGTATFTGTGTFVRSAGTYTFVVTDANGCTANATATIAPAAQISANVTPQNHVIDCIPIPVTLTANPTGGSGVYTYLWSNGATTQSITVNPNSTTTYSVQITDANGCTVNTGSNGTTVTVLNRCGNNNQKVMICHVPSGNPGNAQTICISPNALNPHLGTLWNLHGGDYCGPCQTSSNLTLGTTNTGDNTFIRAGINMNNETIELSYRIGYDSEVRLEIYDMAGTLVDVVHTAEASEGELYELMLTTDKISSGVYIYQFVTDTETHIDKLQIIQ